MSGLSFRGVVCVGAWLWLSAAWAQDKPAPKPEAAKAAAQPAGEKPAVARKASSKRGEDARHCLEKGSNTEVIKCAEAYL